MPYIVPDVTGRWIRARLLESSALAALVGERIHPLRHDFEPIGWPYVLIDESSSQYDNWAEMVTLEHSDYHVYAVMREDYLPPATDIMDYLQPLHKEIFQALEGVSDHRSQGSGFVHSSIIVAPHRRYYGSQRQHIAELGVVARIVAT